MKKQFAQHANFPIFFSHIFLLGYLLFFFFLFLTPSFKNFFVGDDFTWLRWAAESHGGTLIRNFFDAGGFFLRPIDKLFIFLEFTFFHLNPWGYHVVNLLVNFAASIACYFFLYALFKKKEYAFLGAFLFSFTPSHSQDLFWIATISTTLSSVFVIFGLITYYHARMQESFVFYIISFVLFFLSVFSYENAIIFIGLTLLLDLLIVRKSALRKKAVVIFPYVVNLFTILLYVGIRFQSHAAGFSGDYNYNITKLIPNAFGNYAGYLFLFFLSESSLSTYNLLRSNLKNFSSLISIVGFLIVAFIGGFLLEHTRTVRLSEKLRFFIFGLFFSVISLMPYLPLGNITLRYIYLPSLGFIMMGLVVLEYAVKQTRNVRFQLYIMGIVGVVIFLWCYRGLRNSEAYWAKASRITYATFNTLKYDYPLQKDTNYYFYNIPTKIGEAYIFPVGLSDALYFINNDPTVRTFIVKDLPMALNLKSGDMISGQASHIFTFDKSFQLKKVE